MCVCMHMPVSARDWGKKQAEKEQSLGAAGGLAWEGVQGCVPPSTGITTISCCPTDPPISSPPTKSNCS